MVYEIHPCRLVQIFSSSYQIISVIGFANYTAPVNPDSVKFDNIILNAYILVEIMYALKLSKLHKEHLQSYRVSHKRCPIAVIFDNFTFPVITEYIRNIFLF